MNPPTRPLEPDIGQGQEASDLVPSRAKPVTVEHGRRVAVQVLIRAEHRVLEPGRDRRDTAPRDRRPETEPGHDLAAVRLDGSLRGAIRHRMVECRKLGTADVGSVLAPHVVHPVEQARIAWRRNVDRHVAIRGGDEVCGRRGGGHLCRDADTHR